MKTVLLAEDESADVFLLERAFRRLGFACQLKDIRDGQEVIDYLDGTGAYADRAQFSYPSMMILDWNLPTKNGAEILEWIKSKRDLPRLFVIILTGGSPVGAPKETFQQFGEVQVFNCYFLKPISDPNLQMIMKIFETWEKTES